jgi:OOP family OmpA-OmpF porin
LSGSVFAGNHPGAWTVTAGGGYYAFAAKRPIQSTGVPNAALAYDFTSRWAIEADIGVINTRQEAPFSASGVHGGLYLLDGIYRFKPYKAFEPYLLGGIGMISLSPNGNNSEHQGNVNVGIGTQFFMDSMLALRVDVRDIYTLSGGYNEGMLNCGISLLFG